MNNHRLTLLLIMALGLLAYANSFHGSFHYDDVPPIVEGPVIKDLGNLPGILASDRGLVVATFALNYAVGGLDVFGYHVINTTLHIFNAILLYFLLLYTFASPERPFAPPWEQRVAAFSAIIFVVHPLHTQAVSYIIQRFEVMASTFYLLAMLFFLLACRATVRWKMLLLFSAVVASYLLGLKSKEIIVTLPAALLLYDFLFVAQKNLSNLLRRWPVHAALFSICVWFMVKSMALLGKAPVAALAEGVKATDTTTVAATVGFSVAGITPWEYFLTQSNVVIHYLSLIVAPINQNLDYDLPIARSLFQTPVLNEGTVLNFILLPPIIAILLLSCLIVWAFLLARKDSHQAQVVSFCLLMYFIVLSPTSSFIPIVDVIFEHRAYLASVFIIVPLVMALDWLGGVLIGLPGQTQ